MLAIFGGDTNVLRTMLLEERIPDGWEPFVRYVLTYDSRVHADQEQEPQGLVDGRVQPDRARRAHAYQ
jgi:hypothetical protein